MKDKFDIVLLPTTNKSNLILFKSGILFYNSSELKEDNLGWIYPSKSYMVAICYARWLSEEFGNNPIDYLNDIDLLFGNDPYFVTYDEDTITYDQILGYIGGWQFNETKGYVHDVKSYFLKEFMIDSPSII